MGLPRTIRIDDELESELQAYLKKNRMKFPQLVKLALKKFISEPQTITFEPVDKDEFLNVAEKAYKKHEKAMDRLK